MPDPQGEQHKLRAQCQGSLAIENRRTPSSSSSPAPSRRVGLTQRGMGVPSWLWGYLTDFRKDLAQAPRHHLLHIGKHCEASYLARHPVTGGISRHVKLPQHDQFVHSERRLSLSPVRRELFVCRSRGRVAEMRLITVLLALNAGEVHVQAHVS